MRVPLMGDIVQLTSIIELFLRDSLHFRMFRSQLKSPPADWGGLLEQLFRIGGISSSSSATSSLRNFGFK